MLVPQQGHRPAGRSVPYPTRLQGGPPEALKVLPPGALTFHSLWRAGEHVGGEFPSLKYLLFTLEAFVSLLVLYLPAEVRAILPGPV